MMHAVLLSRRLLPYTLAACATVGLCVATLIYALWQLWPTLRHVIHQATAP